MALDVVGESPRRTRNARPAASSRPSARSRRDRRAARAAVPDRRPPRSARRLGGEDRLLQRRRVSRFSRYGRVAGEQFVQQHAQRIDVGARADRPAGDLLGRRVVRRQRARACCVSSARLRCRPRAVWRCRSRAACTWPAASTSTFDGLMSRCTTSCACAYATARGHLQEQAQPRRHARAGARSQ